MTDKFILKAERLLRDYLVTLNHDGTIETAPLDLTELEQLFDIFVNRKCACGGDLSDIGLGI